MPSLRINGLIPTKRRSFVFEPGPDAFALKPPGAKRHPEAGGAVAPGACGRTSWDATCGLTKFPETR